jgi:hypothetical protein
VSCGWTVTRHRFDPVALVVGAVFIAAGAIVLAGGELIDEGRALIPVGLIAVGVALLVHVGRRARPSSPAVAQPAPGVASDTDLDALFAPVDDALADWDRTHGRAETDLTEPDPTETDATPTDASEDVTHEDVTHEDVTHEDVTEVIDPTERYPRPGPE